MAQFAYAAKNEAGKTVRGMIEAEDKLTAVEILRKERLIIINIDDAKKKNLFGGIFKFSKRVKLDDIVIFSRQLATLVEAGIPLFNALDIIGQQMDKPDLKPRVYRIRDDVEAGSSLSEAISKDKQFFSSFYVSMVKAGESSGTLDEILDRIASYLEKTNNLQKKVKSALIYPAVVSLMAVGITTLLMVKVIPVFKEIYGGMGQSLPAPTQMLINASDFMVNNFILMLIGISAMIFGLVSFGKTKKGRMIYDRIKLRIPIVGTLMKQVAVSKFTRTFSTLVKSGVPILASLEIVGKTSGNVVIEDAIDRVKVNVREGENIAAPLAKLTVFPPMVVRMIAIGEKTGELEKMLSKVADFYDAQVDAAVSGLTSLLEPLIIAFLGIVIGGIVICMFLPILQMSQLMQGGM